MVEMMEVVIVLYEATRQQSEIEGEEAEEEESATETQPLERRSQLGKYWRPTLFKDDNDNDNNGPKFLELLEHFQSQNTRPLSPSFDHVEQVMQSSRLFATTAAKARAPSFASESSSHIWISDSAARDVLYNFSSKWIKFPVCLSAGRGLRGGDGGGGGGGYPGYKDDALTDERPTFQNEGLFSWSSKSNSMGFSQPSTAKNVQPLPTGGGLLFGAGSSSSEKRNPTGSSVFGNSRSNTSSNQPFLHLASVALLSDDSDPRSPIKMPQNTFMAIPPYRLHHLIQHGKRYPVPESEKQTSRAQRLIKGLLHRILADQPEDSAPVSTALDTPQLAEEEGDLQVSLSERFQESPVVDSALGAGEGSTAGPVTVLPILNSGVTEHPTPEIKPNAPAISEAPVLTDGAIRIAQVDTSLSIVGTPVPIDDAVEVVNPKASLLLVESPAEADGVNAITEAEANLSASQNLVSTGYMKIMEIEAGLPIVKSPAETNDVICISEAEARFSTAELLVSINDIVSTAEIETSLAAETLALEDDAIKIVETEARFPVAEYPIEGHETLDSAEYDNLDILIQPEIDYEAAVSAYETLNIEPHEILLRPKKMVLSEERRIKTTFLPSFSTVQLELVRMVTDDKTHFQDLILAYSQVAAIYGLHNLDKLEEFLLLLAHRFHNASSNQLIWLFQLPAVHELRSRKRLPQEFLNLKTKMLGRHRVKWWLEMKNPYVEDLLQRPSVPVKTIWNTIKGWTLRERIRNRNSGLQPPLRYTQLIVQRATELLRRDHWDAEKSKAVDTCIDMIRFVSKDEMYVPLLFSDLIKFTKAWVRHYDIRKPPSRSAAKEPQTPFEEQQPPTQNDILSIPEYKPQRQIRVRGIDEILAVLPNAYAIRLLSTILLQPLALQTLRSTEEISLRKKTLALKTLQRVSTWFGLLPKNIVYGDEGHMQYLRDINAIYNETIASKSHEEIAKFLQYLSDLQIIAFYLRIWPNRHGTRYINDEELLASVRLAVEEIIKRLSESINSHGNDGRPNWPGLPFAQAILSVFYLNIPTELLLNDIIRTLATLGKTEELKSCLEILHQFEGRYNGDVKFKTSKYAIKISVDCFAKTNPIWALSLLRNYHNRRSGLFKSVLVRTARQYPNETHLVFTEFLEPHRQKSIWNPQIERLKPGGRPSKQFLVVLAMEYALSENHSPRSALRRINLIRHLMDKYGYGIDQRVNRAIVAVAVVRMCTHKLWTGPVMTSIDELLDHGRLKFGIALFMKHADRDYNFVKGLSRPEIEEKKRAFVEQCMVEVMVEVDKWKKYRAAVEMNKRSMQTYVI
ncbi:hypothetical protein ABW20_dc0102846 [Dactylellina cionopaga]|nr:hypothetical protein ABW20_dc0102846 [Dactylellina cionopaga]